MPDAWATLERHGWPGNVRELRNAAQRLVVLDDDGRITADDIRSALHYAIQKQSAESAPWPVDYAAAQERALREFRAEYVTRLLELHGGNVSRAAEAAHVSRRTLHRWLAELRPATEE